MQEIREDNALIAAYLEGDETALSILVDRYLDDVHAFTQRLVGDASIADDIAQDAFLKAWKHIRSFNTNGSFKSWLFSITRNTAIDFLRKKQSIAFSAFENAEGENHFVAALQDDTPLPDELLARAQDAQYARHILESINPEYREVLDMRHTSNLTFSEIGEVLRRPLHTVKSQYRRAIIALKRAVEQEGARA